MSTAESLEQDCRCYFLLPNLQTLV